MQEAACYLILISAAQGIFFSLVLLGLSSGNRVANRWLAMLTAAFALNMAGTALYDLHVVLRFPHLGLLGTPFAMLIGPGFYFLTKSFTNKQFFWRWWHWFCFLPFLLNILYFIPFYKLSAAEKTLVLQESYIVKPDFWVHSFLCNIFVSFIFIVLTIALILKHERHIEQVFSNLEQKSLRWIMMFFGAVVLTFLVCIMLSFYDMGFADSFSNLTFSAVIYVMGYRSLKQAEIFTNIPQEIVEETDQSALIKVPIKYEKSGLTEQKALHLLEKLELSMHNEKLYLQPELTCLQLADHLGIKPHVLSQVLNQYKRENFFDYINRHRVEHFKQAALDPAKAHLSILAIAFESGFNSKAAFNAVFKKNTGITPSNYRNA